MCYNIARCNYTARTTDFSREIGTGVVSGYGVSMDVCVTGTKDVYVLCGGARLAAWDKYDDIRVRMVSGSLSVSVFLSVCLSVCLSIYPKFLGVHT